jgi:hypothetical protein
VTKIPEVPATSVCRASSYSSKTEREDPSETMVTMNEATWRGSELQGAFFICCYLIVLPVTAIIQSEHKRTSQSQTDTGNKRGMCVSPHVQTSIQEINITQKFCFK